MRYGVWPVNVVESFRELDGQVVALVNPNIDFVAEADNAEIGVWFTALLHEDVDQIAGLVVQMGFRKRNEIVVASVGNPFL